MGQGSGHNLAGLSSALELLKVSIGYWPGLWSYLNLIGERSTSKLTWVLEKSRSVHATGFNASISGWLLARGHAQLLDTWPSATGKSQLATHSMQLVLPEPSGLPLEMSITTLCNPVMNM